MMRAPACFVVLLIAAQAAIAEPFSECHSYRDGPVGLREDVAERLQIAELNAELHAEKMRAAGVQPSYQASSAAVPTREQLRAAFEADSVAWRYACRSPQVVAFDSSLSRAASAALSARAADMARVAQ